MNAASPSSRGAQQKILKRQGKFCVNDDSKISSGRGFHIGTMTIDCDMVNGAFPPAFDPRRLGGVGALVDP
jgi:hypothetical protein